MHEYRKVNAMMNQRNAINNQPIDALTSGSEYGKDEISQLSANMEQEIKQIEHKYIKQSLVWQKFEQYYEHELDKCLEIGDLVKLIKILQDKEFVKRFEAHTKMAYMMLAGQIYQMEIAENAEYTIFEGRKSAKEVIRHMLKVKFLLWHIEFETEGTSGEELLEYISLEKVSIALIKYMVHTVGMSQVPLLKSLAEIFMGQGMLGYSFGMLKYADELCSEQEDILCAMAGLCIRVGKKEEALRCLNRVKHPGHITESFRKLCEV